MNYFVNKLTMPVQHTSTAVLACDVDLASRRKRFDLLLKEELNLMSAV